MADAWPNLKTDLTLRVFLPRGTCSSEDPVTALRKDSSIDAVALDLSDFERSVAVKLSPNSDLSLQLAFTEVTSEV